MNKRRIFAVIFAVLSVALTVFIFSNSLKTADVSQQQSGGIVTTISNLLSEIGISADPETLSFIVRKFAHFSEYFLLGGLIYISAWLFGYKKPLIISISACLAVSVGDEFIAQGFTEGRSPEIRDCIIDLCGAVSSSAIISFITRKKYSDM